MDELLEALRRQARHFGPELARTAYERGLAVTSLDGSTRPIPITATPVIIDPEPLRHRVQLSAALTSAALKMSRSILGGPQREVLLSALSPLERTVAEKTFEASSTLATTRVDYFVDAADLPYALEVNATIPAMQGYSDIAAHAFVEVVGRHFGMKDAHIARLQAKTPSNALALHRALLTGFAEELARKGQPPNPNPRVALLCRRNDSQITEQRYLCERFRDWGTEADVVHPDQLSGTDAVTANGKKYDLVYRHLFVRRLSEPGMEGADYVIDLLSTMPSGKTVVLNPPASQVEVKTTFALLSQALAEPDLAKSAALTPSELSAISACVPWTRPFRKGPSLDCDGQQVTDLVDRVAREPDRFVLKRAWDYGGRAVFVGSAMSEPSFAERVKAAYGEPLDWPALCERTGSDRAGGGFVVQEIVRARAQQHLLCTADAQLPVELFVDFSAYASVGLGKNPDWGGVCRGSPSRIVNIVGGGGVLPLITTEVAQALLLAYRAR